MATFNSSCSDKFLHRLKERFKDGRHRSSWIVKTLSDELDRLDGKDIENKLHNKIVEKIVPEVKKLIKAKDYSEIVDVWSGRPEVRDHLRSQLSMKVSDDDLKMALNIVLREYD